jgi:putative NADH-flavin reductase
MGYVEGRSSVKVILLGATGMVGQGVLRECLLDPEVENVFVIGRNATGPKHEKLHEIVHGDLFNLSAIEDRLSGYDACFFCLGVSAVGMKEESYRRVTYDLTMSVAGTLSRLSPGTTFFYVSGAGTDSTEHGARAYDVGARERSDRKRAVADPVQGGVHVSSGLHPATPRDSDKDEVVWSNLRDDGAPLSSMEVAFP